ncbi:LssY C-terminal domain-containing protein [Palleronia sp. LCG004]|uniref:LssY C-terminal domain-containing protein n=1 Tax=Palleronia sp. LCG004 TaxID=3079304 RepID=UPI00294291F7|nr:LssY C-terminal domain-containing protein [Palleronia sp. LCG004]WOI58042.1 LssY C-terminal domain-containing protein [Palleronia sp. LCG004]
MTRSSKGKAPVRGPRKGRALVRRAALVFGLIAAVWIGMAYFVLPNALRHYDHQPGLEGLEMVTHTADGLAGDPLNVGLVGSQAELVSALTKADWVPADPVTLRTSIGIVGSVVLDRSDRDAPVSPLFYQGRRQDLAFEKAVGRSADRRQHVRFWKVLPSGQEGRPVWLGSASFDTGVGLSHYTGAVTHDISPDIDAMRDQLSVDLAATGLITETYEVTGVGPTLNGRNGGGDRYYTDGEIEVSVIAAPGETGHQPPPKLANPPMVNLKNMLWNSVKTAATSGGSGS